MGTPGVKTSEECRMTKMTSRNMTPTNAATSNCARMIRTLRGNLMRSGGRFSDDVHDFSRSPFHIQDDGVDAVDEIIVTGVARDSEGQAGGGAEERLPNTARERFQVRARAMRLQLGENANE